VSARKDSLAGRRNFLKEDEMQNKSIFIILGSITIVWLGYMAWLSGYEQGYEEGSEMAWNDARTAFSKPLPTLNIETISSKNP
jgi:hypothetical protein